RAVGCPSVYPTDTGYVSISPLDVDNDNSEALRGIEDELNHKPRPLGHGKLTSKSVDIIFNYITI
ncbi:MAG: hypothetical protein ACOC4M_03810, partial [Promethearchaeia archaeon]